MSIDFQSINGVSQGSGSQYSVASGISHSMVGGSTQFYTSASNIGGGICIADEEFGMVQEQYENDAMFALSTIQRAGGPGVPLHEPLGDCILPLLLMAAIWFVRKYFQKKKVRSIDSLE